MKDSYYFKHDANASSDIKLRAIRKKYSWKGIGWFWFLIEQLRNQDNYKLPYNELTYEGLSGDMDCTAEETKKFIDDCLHFGLLKKNGEHFSSDRLSRDMDWLDEKREKTRKAGLISAEKRYGKTPEQASVPSSAPTTKTEARNKTGAETDIGKMIETYELRIGKTLTPNELDQLKDISDNYPLGDYEKAIEEAVKNNVRSPVPYIAKVLEAWQQKKVPKKKVSVASATDGNTVGMLIE